MTDATNGNYAIELPSAGDLAVAAAINNVVSATCIALLGSQSKVAAKTFLDTLQNLNDGLIGAGGLRDKLQEGVAMHHDIVDRM